MESTIAIVLKKQWGHLLSLFFIPTIKRRIFEAKQFARTERAFIDFKNKSAKVCLTLGCGNSPKDGWFNTDVNTSQNVFYLDATKYFPILADSVDVIHTEHMIEHLPIEGAFNLVSESFRVLKSGGVLRIATPDMNFLFNLYGDSDADLHRRYLKWAGEKLYPETYQKILPNSSTFVINNFVRDWGHLVIFDEATLLALVAKAGFENSKVYQSGLSENTDFRVWKITQMPFLLNLMY
jgi:predicted SAM-dependent methyltransferase